MILIGVNCDCIEEEGVEALNIRDGGSVSVSVSGIGIIGIFLGYRYRYRYRYFSTDTKPILLLFLINIVVLIGTLPFWVFKS